MFCPNCGTPHEDWVRFCTECGASMDVVIHPPVATEESAAASVPIKEEAPAVEAALVEEAAPIVEETSPVENDRAVDPAQYYTPVLETVEPVAQEQPLVEQTPYVENEELPVEEEVPLKHPVPMGEKPVSLGKWIALLALEMLSSLAHIVLLFVWAFSKNSEKSMQNYARAKLIVMGASIILAALAIIMFTVFVVPHMDLSSFRSFVNSF